MKSNGKVPVQDFLYSLEPKLRAKAFNDIELLHGFIKKTMKTPEKEIDKARKYMEDYKRRADS